MDTLNINDVNTIYSLRVTKYIELRNLEDLKETRQDLVNFQFKFGYVEEQLFVAVSVNSYKSSSFIEDV